MGEARPDDVFHLASLFAGMAYVPYYGMVWDGGIGSCQINVFSGMIQVFGVRHNFKKCSKCKKVANP